MKVSTGYFVVEWTIQFTLFDLELDSMYNMTVGLYLFQARENYIESNISTHRYGKSYISKESPLEKK